MAAIYVGRHSLAVWGDKGLIGDVRLTPDEQENIATQMLRHASERRRNGDLPAKDQEQWKS